MKSIIVGAGQVGSALYEILKKYYPRTYIIDYDEFSLCTDPDIIHICFGYSDDFETQVTEYQRIYKPKYTVIHSSVPPGTSRKLNACHSPIRGQHPNLAEGIKTFVKFVSGTGADTIAEYFRRANLKVQICRMPETTELAKIMSTTYYAVCIEFTKEMERICEKYEVSFNEAVTLWSLSYNEGWERLGYPEYHRPILIPIRGPQGGHCTIPNLEFLKESKFADLVKELQKE